ncbi:MAG TPA: hypothetical protein VK151_07150 [Fluviicola sp.]|nr:hypothetical protein [Fluviicola sp.]
MTDKEQLIKAFVDNFVLKDKRERCYAELTNPKKRGKFTDKLNHKWDTILDMRCLVKIDKTNDSPGNIQKILKLRDNDLCYIISNYDDVDDQLIPFKNAFDRIYSRGLGTLLMNASADTLFLDTEQVQGPATRFTGKK